MWQREESRQSCGLSQARSRVVICDTTLRDGEQSPGVSFRRSEKIDLALRLADAGVREIEAGTAAMGGEELCALREMARIVPRRFPGTRIWSWNRLDESDLAASLAIGIDSIYISVPASDRQFALARLSGGESELIERLERLMAVAQCGGAGVVVGLQDATRAPLDRLERLALAAARLGALRLRLSDTVGVLTPARTAGLVASLRSALDAGGVADVAGGGMALQIHTHNDFGMATANALAAVEAGATHVDTTILGLGERAGNAPLDEVVVALERLYNVSTGIDLKSLLSLSERVATLTGEPIARRKPLLGANAFSHESGVHAAAVARDPECYEPISPELLGRERSLPIGKHSGRSSLVRRLAELGVVIDRDEATQLLSRCRRLAERKRSTLSDAELLTLRCELTQAAECSAAQLTSAL